MISVINVQKQFGGRTLFENASFNLNKGERYGLVGANGSGKSTFMRMLIGEETPTSGDFRIVKSAEMAFLRQDQFIHDDVLIIDNAMQGDKAGYAILREKAQLEQMDAQHVDPERWILLEEKIESLSAYRLKAKASEILEGLGIAREVHEQPLRVLSGGYKLRVLLAQILLSRADIVLLDEPTNHLDILSIRWLEKFLSNFERCLIVISHDRRFLDQVTSHTLDVDYGTITLYTGNYTSFVEQKAKIREQKEAEIENINKDIAHKQAFVDRFKAKASKARQAQSRIKQIEKIEIPELKRSSRRYPKVAFEVARPSGKEVLTVEHLSKSYGQKTVLQDLNFEIRNKERVAIIGPNGVGKSTLLKLLSQSVEDFTGRYKWGYEASIGYFAQDHDVTLRQSAKDAEDWLWQFCPEQSQTYVRSLLGRLLFVGEEAKKRVRDLSGGELARLELGRLMLAQSNVLLLDEPTNHLDMEALEALVSSLKEYEGTLIFVSHDRYFVSELANRIIELKPLGMNDFKGTFQEYLAALGDDHLDAQAILKLEKKNDSGVDSDKEARIRKYEENKQKAQRDRKIKTRLEEIAKAIEALEQRQVEIEQVFIGPGFFEKASRDEIRNLQDEQERAKEKIDILFAEWAELET
jgi:ATPase subunit of ABC transporter with duplicated ATPase domains